MSLVIDPAPLVRLAVDLAPAPRRTSADLTLHDLARRLVQARADRDDVAEEVYGELLYRLRRCPELLPTYYQCVYCDAIRAKRTSWTSRTCDPCWDSGVHNLEADYRDYWQGRRARRHRAAQRFAARTEAAA